MARRYSLALTSIFTGLLLASASHAQERAVEADNFVDSIGINTHFTYTNTPYYQNSSTAIRALQKLGVRHIRDGYFLWPASSPLYTIHQQLKSAGIWTNYVVTDDMSFNATKLTTFKTRAQDVESIEAPNEMDLNPPGWATDLRNLLPVMKQAGSATGTAVLGPALVYPQSYAELGDISEWIDYDSLHLYFGGRNPGSQGWGGYDAQGHSYGSIDFWLDYGKSIAGNKPSMVTENGYIQLLGAPVPFTVPATIAAPYTLRTFLEMWNHGITRTYIYQLLDDPSSPLYGIMKGNFQPTSAYTSLSNLIANLSDPGPSFTPGSLSYTLTGATQDVHHTLMQKRDGTFYLALWIESSVYTPSTNTSTPVPWQYITIHLDNAHGAQSVTTLHEDGSVTWNTLSTPNPSTYTFNVSSNVKLLKISPK